MKQPPHWLILGILFSGVALICLKFDFESRRPRNTLYGSSDTVLVRDAAKELVPVKSDYDIGPQPRQLTEDEAREIFKRIPKGSTNVPRNIYFAERDGAVPHTLRRYTQIDGEWVVEEFDAVKKEWHYKGAPVFTNDQGIPFGGAK